MALIEDVQLPRFKRSRLEQGLETATKRQEQQRQQAANRPWQFIPRAVLDEEQHRAEVSDWALRHRSELASAWREHQKQLGLQRLQELVEQAEPMAGIGRLAEQVQRYVIEPTSELAHGPVLRGEVKPPQSVADIGPFAGRLAAHAVERLREGVDVPEMARRWREETPEPLPGVKGALEVVSPIGLIGPGEVQAIAKTGALSEGLLQATRRLAPASAVEDISKLKPSTAAVAAAGLPGPPGKAPAATGMVPPASEEFAANIRLEKYPNDVREIIKGYADTHADEIETYRRGVRSDEQVMADAKALVEQTGGDFDRLAKRWKPGEAFNAEEIAALRGTLRAKAEEVQAAQQAIHAGGDTSENLLRLRLALEEHASVQKVVHGATAEAGRALRQFRRPVAEALRSGNQLQIERALKALGGREVNEEIARAFAAIDVDNPDAVYKFIRDVTNPKLNDYIVELFYNSILSGPKTHIVNALSNTLTAITSPIERAAAAAVDVPLSALQGRPRERFLGEATADIVGLVRGIPEGLRAAAYVLKHGFTPQEATKWEFRPHALEAGLEHKFGETGQKVGRAANLPTTALEAADQFYRAINYRAALNAEAYRLARKEGLTDTQAISQRMADLLSDPTPDLMERAGKVAEYRIFRQEAGSFTKGVMKLRDADIYGIQPLRLVIPFLQIPVNLLKFGLERSPLGFLNPKLWQDVAKKSPEAADEIARASLGSIFAAAIAAYAADGKITGAAPSNKLDRDRFYREGKQPYSIKIGDQWVSYQRLEPFNQPLSQVAAIVEALRSDDKDALERASQVGVSIGKNLVSQTYMTTVSDLLNALAEPERYGSNFLQRTVVSIVTPFSSLLRTGAQALDPTIREPRGIAETILAGLPGLSENVPARLNAFGEEQVRETPAWSPIAVSTEKETLLNRELSRLDVDVGFVGDSIQGLPLTREEHYQYQQAVGQMRKAFLERLVAHPSYQQANDRTKAKLLEAAVNDVRTDAADAFLQALLKKLSRDEIKQRLQSRAG